MSGRSSEVRNGRKRSNGLSKFSGSWEGFVDIDLTQEDRERLGAIGPEDYPDFLSWLDEVLSDGYKFSITRDEKHHCDIATLTGKNEGCLNAGYSLSSRGPGMFGALLALYFKHTVVCEGQRWAGHERQDERRLSLWG